MDTPADIGCRIYEEYAPVPDAEMLTQPRQSLLRHQNRLKSLPHLRFSSRKVRQRLLQWNPLGIMLFASHGAMDTTTASIRTVFYVRCVPASYDCQARRPTNQSTTRTGGARSCRSTQPSPSTTTDLMETTGSNQSREIRSPHTLISPTRTWRIP